LLADEVEACDELGDRVLDLDAAVQLEEPEVAPVQHELGGASTRIADRAGEADGGVAHRGAQLGIERGGGGFLEHLLVTALDRALSLAECDHIPVRVPEQLDLDVARPLDVALAEDRVVAEGGLRLAPGRFERLVERLWVTDNAHPAPAPACRGLHDERIADFPRIALRDDRDAGLPRDPLRL